MALIRSLGFASWCFYSSLCSADKHWSAFLQRIPDVAWLALDDITDTFRSHWMGKEQMAGKCVINMVILACKALLSAEGIRLKKELAAPCLGSGLDGFCTMQSSHFITRCLSCLTKTHDCRLKCCNTVPLYLLVLKLTVIHFKSLHEKCKKMCIVYS